MAIHAPDSPAQSAPELARVVERNIESLLAHQETQKKERSIHDKIVDAITKFTGSMLFIYLHLLIFGVWIAINLGWLPFAKFDSTFHILAMLAAVEAIFLTAFVLNTQNRMVALSDQRAHLELQISLLAEHEVTQLLKLVADIAERVGVNVEEISELDELAQEVRPEVVMETIESAEKNSAHEAQT